MDYQSYAPWFEKVAQTYIDKPIFKLSPIEFDQMCNGSLLAFCLHVIS